jgi:coenzyme F420-reducing hydrogenase delta subunit/ferredoxin
MSYEPKIIAFLCTWCSYTGADTAGIARLKSPANLRAIRVPCSGRVSPEFIMRAFDQGADGVLVLGCHIGECHYDSGNHRAAKRIPVLQKMLAFAGLDEARLRLDWVSASEGERFSRIVTEFVDTVRALGPVRWRAATRTLNADRPTAWSIPPAPQYASPVLQEAARRDAIQAQLQEKARELLASGQVGCVIGYEPGTHGRTRPAFVYDPAEAERLTWNQDCTHNLTTYLHRQLAPPGVKPGSQKSKPVAVVVKPCDSRAINVLLTENKFTREQVHLIGVACDGIHSVMGDKGSPLQARCLECSHPLPVAHDTMIGETLPAQPVAVVCQHVAELADRPVSERMDFWLEQFDRCIRCYACRQACPMCDCPTCLYERDDSLWVGMGAGVNEKRTFHLGRAYHLAGRCIGCNECERVCPMEIPISLLNQALAQEMQELFAFRPGLAPAPSPFVTILNGEERLP